MKKSLMTVSERAAFWATKAERKVAKAEAKVAKAEAKLEAKKAKLAAAKRLYETALAQSGQQGVGAAS